jgi:hypothetical protein
MKSTYDNQANIGLLSARPEEALGITSKLSLRPQDMQ